MRLIGAVARTVPLVCGLLVGLRSAPAQVRLTVGPYDLGEFLVQANSLGLREPFGSVAIGAVGADKLEFRFRGVTTGEGRPNFIVVSPSSGVAPAFVAVGLNPNVVPYLRPGSYSLSLVFEVPGQPCPPACGGTFVTLRLYAPPAPTVTGVVNAATLEATISPGALVSILGTDLSTPPITAQYDSAGLYPTSLGDTTVTFNGIAAPLVYVSTSQINAVVPYGVAGQKTVEVVVRHYLPASPFSLPIADTSPGIFSVSQTGRGQGAILNTNSTPNSVDNPARKGSVIQIFATGAGVWVLPAVPNTLPQSVLDGSIYLGAPGPSFIPRPAAPVSLTIAGQPARMQYMGPAPYQVFGMLQVNAVVPDGIDSGPQPVVLTIGNSSNSQQQVTVAVQ
jgi:uncharacterized protein (TIGR03437 family)